MSHQNVLILDFGGQYNQLIARRVRDLGVYCEILPFRKATVEKIQEYSPIGLIFTGGPNSVYAENAPKIDPQIFELGIPVLGLCYGCQLIAHTLGGKVETAPSREFGKTVTHFDTTSPLFQDLPEQAVTWMSHVDYVDKLPEGFTVPEGRVKPWGTAHAILVAEEAIGDAPFAVINADDYYGPQGFKLIYDYLSTHADGDRYAWAMVGFLLGNTVSANGSVSRGVCVTDESRNLVSVTERTCIEPYANGIHYSEDGGKSWADLPADCVVSMNLWGFTPAYVQEAKAGFAAFLQASLPVNPMKCEYYLPTVVTNALEAGKADVHVLTSADKWHGITYREDKPELVEALKKMSEDGLYPVDRLF